MTKPTLSGIQARIESWDARKWRRAVLATAALALLARAVVIAVTGGGFNLRIFHYFGGLIARGVNPYDAPPGGEFDPRYGDNPPPELLLFAGLLEIHDSPDTLRVFFALADGAVIATVGLWYPRSRTFRANFIAFYAFNPLMLEAWTGFADDKALLLLCTIGVLAGLDAGRLALSWGSAIALAALKWYSVVFAPALALHSARLRSRGWTVAACLAFVGVVALAQLPYLPDSLDAFARRSDRISIDPPIHAAITQLLAEVNLYSTLIPRVFWPLSLGTVYALYLLRKIDIKDTVVLSVFCSYIALPDEGFNRMLLITLPFLFLIGMSLWRWTVLWFLSILAAGAVLVEFRDVDLDLAESLFGAYGSLEHVVFVNVVMVAVLVFYLRDRLGASGPGAVEATP
ncbi:MAG: hypothetical protein WDZ37_03525 [Solirubrobacterales bacterium]